MILTVPVLFYIHGFNSSPQSWKARLLGDYIRDHALPIDYRVPELPWEPQAAAALLLEEVGEVAERAALVGSSMGGYYACWLQSRFSLPAVLLNPAVRPYELLQDYLGENRNLYSAEHYELRPEHVEQLRSLDVDPPTTARLMYLVQTGDETLDYRQAVSRFRRYPGIIEPGGTHGLDGFERWIPATLAFLGLPLPDSGA